MMAYTGYTWMVKTNPAGGGKFVQYKNYPYHKLPAYLGTFDTVEDCAVAGTVYRESVEAEIRASYWAQCPRGSGPCIPLLRHAEIVAWIKVDEWLFSRIEDAGPWHACEGKGGGWYAVNSQHGSLHRWLLGLDRNDPRFGDHINGEPTDNRLLNLRIVDPTQNGQNRGIMGHNTSGYPGVSRGKNGRWRGYVQSYGKMMLNRTYPSRESAIAAVAKFRAEHLTHSVENSRSEYGSHR